MAKPKRRYVCRACGAVAPRWMGQCPACGEWDSLEEEVALPSAGKAAVLEGKAPVALRDVTGEDVMRWDMADPELNRVLGGGLVKGSLVLFGGAPGIGKSTLLLQMALNTPKQTVLYVAGEESPRQVKMRAERLKNTIREGLLIVDQTDVAAVLSACQTIKPDILIVDSLHTLSTAVVDGPPGSISQLKAVTYQLMQAARDLEMAVIIVGHVTKEGQVAGPRLVEHMVDVVLYLEGDRQVGFRLLRAVKNRFGAVSEIGVYVMTGQGLQPVQDPSAHFLTERRAGVAGVAGGVTVEGIRPLMLEVQALVSPSYYQIPQRSATGYDPKRLQMLLAVLEKRVHKAVGGQDVFLNITGGFRIKDTALDLAVVMALASAHADAALPPRAVFVGEVGLTGELRPVPFMEMRIDEALRHGAEPIVVPAAVGKGPASRYAGVRSFATVREVVDEWLG